MPPSKVDVGLGTGKKKERRGFKQDRFDAYQRKMLGKKQKEPSAKEKKTSLVDTKRAKMVRFDKKEREEFLGGFHKRKNERRVSAFVDMKRKIAKENAKLRKEQREEARRQYNSYAKVPILPDYSFRLPKYNADGTVAKGGDEDDEDEDEYHHRIEEDDGSGGVINTADGDSIFLADDADPIHVSVKPLFAPVKPSGSSSSSNSGNRGGGGAGAGGMGGVEGTQKGHDFSDLPKEVAKELHALRLKAKGPAQMKKRVRTLKELEKIRKIQKHSRKGFGKKSKSGKKKNRHK